MECREHKIGYLQEDILRTCPQRTATLVVGVADTGRLDIGTRGQRQVVASLNVDVLAPDIDIAVGCIDGDASEGTDIDSAKR